MLGVKAQPSGARDSPSGRERVRLANEYYRLGKKLVKELKKRQHSSRKDIMNVVSKFKACYPHGVTKEDTLPKFFVDPSVFFNPFLFTLSGSSARTVSLVCRVFVRLLHLGFLKHKKCVGQLAEYLPGTGVSLISRALTAILNEAKIIKWGKDTEGLIDICRAVHEGLVGSREVYADVLPQCVTFLVSVYAFGNPNEYTVALKALAHIAKKMTDRVELEDHSVIERGVVNTSDDKETSLSLPSLDFIGPISGEASSTRGSADDCGAMTQACQSMSPSPGRFATSSKDVSAVETSQDSSEQSEKDFDSIEEIDADKNEEVLDENGSERRKPELAKNDTDTQKNFDESSDSSDTDSDDAESTGVGEECETKIQVEPQTNTAEADGANTPRPLDEITVKAVPVSGGRTISPRGYTSTGEQGAEVSVSKGDITGLRDDCVTERSMEPTDIISPLKTKFWFNNGYGFMSTMVECGRGTRPCWHCIEKGFSRSVVRCCVFILCIALTRSCKTVSKYYKLTRDVLRLVLKGMESNEIPIIRNSMVIFRNAFHLWYREPNCIQYFLVVLNEFLIPLMESPDAKPIVKGIVAVELAKVLYDPAADVSDDGIITEIDNRSRFDTRALGHAKTGSILFSNVKKTKQTDGDQVSINDEYIYPKRFRTIFASHWREVHLPQNGLVLAKLFEASDSVPNQQNVVGRLISAFSLFIQSGSAGDSKTRQKQRASVPDFSYENTLKPLEIDTPLGHDPVPRGEGLGIFLPPYDCWLFTKLGIASSVFDPNEVTKTVSNIELYSNNNPGVNIVPRPPEPVEEHILVNTLKGIGIYGLSCIVRAIQSGHNSVLEDGVNVGEMASELERQFEETMKTNSRGAVASRIVLEDVSLGRSVVLSARTKVVMDDFVIAFNKKPEQGLRLLVDNRFVSSLGSLEEANPGTCDTLFFNALTYCYNMAKKSVMDGDTSVWTELLNDSQMAKLTERKKEVGILQSDLNAEIARIDFDHGLTVNNLPIEHKLPMYLPRPRDTAKLLISISNTNIDKTEIGDFLGTPSLYSCAVILEYSSLLSGVRIFQKDQSISFEDDTSSPWSRMDVVDAMRSYLKLFRLPGETQKIERILEVFAQFYSRSVASNPSDQPEIPPPLAIDTVFTLSFALMMLHTDLHNPNVEAVNKMSRDKFLENVRLVKLEGVTDSMLRGYYDNINESEFIVSGIPNVKRRNLFEVTNEKLTKVLPISATPMKKDAGQFDTVPGRVKGVEWLNMTDLVWWHDDMKSLLCSYLGIPVHSCPSSSSDINGTNSNYPMTSQAMNASPIAMRQIQLAVFNEKKGGISESRVSVATILVGILKLYSNKILKSLEDAVGAPGDSNSEFSSYYSSKLTSLAFVPLLQIPVNVNCVQICSVPLVTSLSAIAASVLFQGNHNEDGAASRCIESLCRWSGFVNDVPIAGEVEDTIQLNQAACPNPELPPILPGPAMTPLVFSSVCELFNIIRNPSFRSDGAGSPRHSFLKIIQVVSRIQIILTRGKEKKPHNRKVKDFVELLRTAAFMVPINSPKFFEKNGLEKNKAKTVPRQAKSVATLPKSANAVVTSLHSISSFATVTAANGGSFMGGMGTTGFTMNTIGSGGYNAQYGTAALASSTIQTKIIIREFDVDEALARHCVTSLDSALAFIEVLEALTFGDGSDDSGDIQVLSQGIRKAKQINVSAQPGSILSLTPSLSTTASSRLDTLATLVTPKVSCYQEKGTKPSPLLKLLFQEGDEKRFFGGLLFFLSSSDTSSLCIPSIRLFTQCGLVVLYGLKTCCVRGSRVLHQEQDGESYEHDCYDIIARIVNSLSTVAARTTRADVDQATADIAKLFLLTVAQVTKSTQPAGEKEDTIGNLIECNSPSDPEFRLRSKSEESSVKGSPFSTQAATSQQPTCSQGSTMTQTEEKDVITRIKETYMSPFFSCLHSMIPAARGANSFGGINTILSATKSAFFPQANQQQHDGFIVPGLRTIHALLTRLVEVFLRLSNDGGDAPSFPLAPAPAPNSKSPTGASTQQGSASPTSLSANRSLETSVRDNADLRFMEILSILGVEKPNTVIDMGGNNKRSHSISVNTKESAKDLRTLILKSIESLIGLIVPDGPESCNIKISNGVPSVRPIEAMRCLLTISYSNVGSIQETSFKHVGDAVLRYFKIDTEEQRQTLEDVLEYLATVYGGTPVSNLFDEKVELVNSSNVSRSMKDIFGVAMPGDSSFGMFTELSWEGKPTGKETESFVFECFDNDLFVAVRDGLVDLNERPIPSPLLVWQASVMAEMFTGLLGVVSIALSPCRTRVRLTATATIAMMINTMLKTLDKLRNEYLHMESVVEGKAGCSEDNNNNDNESEGAKRERARLLLRGIDVMVLMLLKLVVYPYYSTATSISELNDSQVNQMLLLFARKSICSPHLVRIIRAEMVSTMMKLNNIAVIHGYQQRYIPVAPITINSGPTFVGDLSPTHTLVDILNKAEKRPMVWCLMQTEVSVMVGELTSMSFFSNILSLKDPAVLKIYNSYLDDIKQIVATIPIQDTIFEMMEQDIITSPRAGKAGLNIHVILLSKLKVLVNNLNRMNTQLVGKVFCPTVPADDSKFIVSLFKFEVKMRRILLENCSRIAVAYNPLDHEETPQIMLNILDCLINLINMFMERHTVMNNELQKQRETLNTKNEVDIGGGNDTAVGVSSNAINNNGSDDSSVSARRRAGQVFNVQHEIGLILGNITTIGNDCLALLVTFPKSLLAQRYRNLFDIVGCALLCESKGFRTSCRVLVQLLK